MPIEFYCPECQQQLRVAEQYAGKPARCPKCQAAVTVPAQSQPLPESADPQPMGAGNGPTANAGGTVTGGFSASTGGTAGDQWLVKLEDGQQYGPVSKAELDQWVNDGRLSAECHVLQVGGTQWQWADSLYPQLRVAGAASSGSANPYQTPAMHNKLPPAAMGGLQRTIIDPGKVINDTWIVYQEQFGLAIGVFLIAGLVGQVANAPANIVDFMIRTQRPDQDTLLLLLPLNIILSILGTCVSVWINIGATKVFLDIARGNSVEIMDVFGGGKHFLPILGLSILLGLMTFFGLLACIVPGVILGLMFYTSYYLVIDRGMRVFDSLSASVEFTNGNKGALFLIGLTYVGLILLGMLMCLIGLLATMPMVMLMGCMAYLGVTGQPNAVERRMQLQTV